MRYPPEILDEIRARLPVSTLVAKRVRLKKAGREWKGLSPFQAEKTPSFFVNDQKGFFHCFSSGRHGDVFAWVQEIEGLTFPEAVERLAAQAGVDLPKESPRAAAEARRRRDLHDVLALAAAFFEGALKRPEAAPAAAFLTRRGLASHEVLTRFRLGYAPAERYALRDHLAAQGVPVEDMIEAGLLVTGEDIAVPYDRFRDRVMFPIRDGQGRVVSFGGRAVRPEVQPKYLNGPETPLFSKGALLFNLDRAREPAHRSGVVHVVEGYTDVIGLNRVGIRDAVATLGTALTADHLALLWRLADEPVLCFDGDGAGRRATWRAIDVALPLLAPGKSLRFAVLPPGQDPDDLARAGGRPAVDQVLGAARPLVDVLWEREASAPSDTPERRAALERRVEDLVAGISDRAVRFHYGSALRARLRDAFRPPARVYPSPERGGGRGGAARAGAGPLASPAMLAVLAGLKARSAAEPGSFDGDEEACA
ncbi:DNA primase [Salinarimonas soli]|uniref:DNA primase n=1 Tax=Salinarimonas soli TaxID=1638099 RepID=A0A5B2VH88_9HYPH|nr:DNA primase [Salinarimonas soli]